MRYFIAILIFSISSFSKAQVYESVLNDCFLEIIGTWYYEPFPPNPNYIQLDMFSTRQDSLDYIRLEKEYEIEKQKIELNNQRKIILINDNVVQLNSNAITDIIEQEIEDTNIVKLRKKLIDTSISPLKKIKIDEIENTGKYELVYLSKRNNLKKPFRLVSKIYFSQIVYNETVDKALFYYHFYCGGECGYASLVYLEKENDKWILKEQIGLWIS